MLATPIEVKKAYKEGTYRKNYRFVVLNDDGTEDFTIDNDTLVAESVHIDERMATGSELKFGLCEGSSLEFQYFDHPNINGRQVQAFIDVQYRTSSVIKTQTDNVFKAYDAGEYVVHFAANRPSGKLDIDYGNRQTEVNFGANPSETELNVTLGATNTITIVTSDPITVTIYKNDGSAFMQWHPIPMGYFTVKECPRQFSTGIYKATAYNKLQSDYLDAKANDLLLADFGGDGSVSLTMYDIQKHLLENYEITERPKSHIPLVETSFIPNALSYGFCKFNLQYGISNPLAYGNCKYVAGSTPPSTGISIVFNGIGATVTTTSSQFWDIEYLKGDIEVFASNLLEFIADTIVAANFNGFNRTIVEEIIKSHAPFYIDIDGTRYNLMNNGNSKLAQINNLIHHGASTINLVIPSEVGFSFDNYLPPDTSYMTFSCQKAMSYKYYANSSMSSYSDGTITPDIRFADGSLYGETTTASDIFAINSYTLSDAEKVTVTIEDLPDFTLRDIVSANYETQCQYGQLDRQTDLFSGVELNGGGLYPAETLYPASGLYPNSNTGGQGIHPYPSEYSQLWTDELGEQSFRYLIITYKTLDENNNEVDAVLQRTVNADGTTDYNMSDNWLFRNLVWTASDVGDYADAMVLKMQDIRWFPFEMWAAGLPYVETGDAIEITDREGNTHISYILQRQLQGIQNLQDTYVNGELDIF